METNNGYSWANGGVVQKLAYWVLGSVFPRVRHQEALCLHPCAPCVREGNFLYLTLRSETEEEVVKDEIFARPGNWTRDSGSKAQYPVH